MQKVRIRMNQQVCAYGEVSRPKREIKILAIDTFVETLERLLGGDLASTNLQESINT